MTGNERKEIIRSMGGLIAIFLAFFLLGIAHVSAQEPEVVENGFRGSMRTAPVLTERAVIGEEGPEEGLLYRPGGLLFDPDGNVYIPDLGNSAIQVYGRDGSFRHRIGRKGSGPGELQMPMGAYFNWNGEIVAPDLGNNRVSYFSPDGTYLRSELMQMEGGVMIVGGRVVRAAEGEYIRAGLGGGGMVMLGEEGPPPLQNQDLLQVFNDEGTVVRSFGVGQRFDDMRVAMLMNQMFFDYSADGKVVVGYLYRDVLELYNATTGDLEVVFKRRLAFRPKPPSSEMTQLTTPGGDVALVPSEIPDQITRGVAFDQEGRVWVLTRLLNHADTEEKELEGDYSGLLRFEIFSPGGELLTVIPLEAPVTVFRFDGSGDLWTLDSRYTNLVHRYEVRWP